MLRSPSTLIWWAPIGFVLAGAAWVAPDLLGLVGYVQFTLRLVGMLLLALGLVGLHTLQGESYGNVGWAGFYTAFVATIAQALSALAIILLRPLAATSFAPLLALAALFGLWASLGWLVGFVLLGVATLRAREGVPRWYGILLIIFALVLVGAHEHRGFSDYEWPGMALVVLGLVLGLVLWVRRGTPLEHPPEGR